MVCQFPAAYAIDANQSYNLSTPSGGYFAGYATATGDITFHSKTSVAISGQVDDHCPADGAGAFLTAEVSYGNGTIGTYAVAQDTQGCGAGPVSFSKFLPNPDNRNVQSLSLRLCETDTSMPFGCQDMAVSRSHLNPYTN